MLGQRGGREGGSRGGKERRKGVREEERSDRDRLCARGQASRPSSLRVCMLLAYVPQECGRVDGDEGVGEEGMHAQVRGASVLGQRRKVEAQLAGMRVEKGRNGGSEGEKRRKGRCG